MKVTVQKFGGTCIESDANQLLTAERIMEARDRGLHPVVVVSAMGRQGQPYSTAEFVSMVRRIHADIEPRELDLLMSCGEIISTVAMAHLLRTKGYETIALSGGQAGLVTDEYYGHAHIVRINPALVLDSLQDGYMVFVAGFQGNTQTHQTTTLGAGGSDHTAVALTRIINETEKLPFGEDLVAEPLHVFKEVDGVMSANPKTLDEIDGGPAQTIAHLTYDECVAMSRLGAEVLQHQAAEMARRHRIGLIVRNVHQSDNPGTQVGAATAPVKEGRVTAVVDQPALLVFDLNTDSARLPLQIAERLGRARLTYYQASTPGAEARFAVRPFKYRDVGAIVREILNSRNVSAEIQEGNLALVSVVGEALRQRLDEWDEQAERVLTDAGIEIHGKGRDDISLSYLVPEQQRKNAVGLLHKALVL